MKNTIFRLFTLAVCLVMVFTMFPVSADAASNSYSTLSSKQILLAFPETLFPEPLHAYVDGDQKNGGIYYVPQPETGNGNLGIVKDGTTVTIFAEENGYYFFMTNSGRMGWNKKVYFTEPKEYTKDKVSSKYGLTLDHLYEVQDFLKDNSKAGGSDKYYPSKSIVLVEKGKTVSLTVYGKYKYKSSTRFKVEFWGDYCKPAWKTKFQNGKATLTIKGKQKGSERLYFSNNYTDKEFEVLVIVV